MTIICWLPSVPSGSQWFSWLLRQPASAASSLPYREAAKIVSVCPPSAADWPRRLPILLPPPSSWQLLANQWQGAGPPEGQLSWPVSLMGRAHRGKVWIFMVFNWIILFFLSWKTRTLTYQSLCCLPCPQGVPCHLWHTCHTLATYTIISIQSVSPKSCPGTLSQSIIN